MTKYVKNPEGTVHSVADDFELPDKTWSDASKSDASEQLLGKAPDPAVAAVELKEGPSSVPDSNIPNIPADDAEVPAETTPEVSE